MNAKTYPVLPHFVLLLYTIAATAGVFIGGLWAALGIGGALVLFLSVWSIEKQVPWPQTDFSLLVLCTLVIAALLNFQSSQPDISWRTWLKLATVFLPVILLSSPQLRARVFHPDFVTVVLVASIVGALALSIELVLGVPLLKMTRGAINAAPTHYNRGLSYLVILAFPLMAGLCCGFVPVPPKKRLWLVAGFILVLLVPTGLTESRAAKLALIVALAATTAAHLWPVLTRRVLATLPVLCIGWPFAAQQFFLAHHDWLSRLPDSWRARVEIWDYMSYRIMERPLLGWGLGTAHTLPFQEPHGAQYVFTVIPAAHPHNVMTQLWVELGLPGLALGLIFALLMFKKAGELDAKIMPFAMGAWVAAFCLSLVAYDFWTDSLFVAFALTSLAFALLERNKPVV